MPKRVLLLVMVALLVSARASAGTVADELSSRLDQGIGLAATDEEAGSLAVLAPFYRGRAMAPVWVSESGSGARARTLARLLAEADRDTLDPEDYGAREIQALLGATESDSLAELELRLSLGLVQFASDLGEGRVAPHIADPDLFIFRDEVDKAQVIAAAAEAGDMAVFIDRYRPQTVRYDRLKAAVADYRKLAALGGWTPIPEGPVLKPGMTDPRVALLRARLEIWGDLKDEDGPGSPGAPAGGNPNVYDDAMVEAVKWMQYRHGLEQDGVVGKMTLAALNVPAETRIAQMTLNLERRRWMPDDLGQRHIFVNLADFTLKLVDEPRTLFDTRVVVGKTYHMTPIFSERMTYLVINPYWNVPPSIARKEILPKIKEDVGYLARKNFTLFDGWGGNAATVDPATVDWSQVSRGSFPFKLRQGSGGGNALGRIKFMFPNRFNVYLHDTPAKSLFARADRTFSHGCVRVEDPLALAELVLANKPGWPLDRIRDAVDSGERRVVTLAAPLPVHLSYLTSWVNKDGSVHFRDDVYGRDAELARALLGPGAMPMAQ